jgi:regulator of sigma E protease
MAGQLILALTILVVIHELGHFIAARAFGIRVEKFFVFFDAGYKIWSKKIGETEFGIGWLPLGGYVKISGMIDESMDTKQLKKEPEPWEFRSKPAWQKLIVMVAGVVMNVILAFIILTFVHLKYTQSYLPIENVPEGIYAYQAGRELGFESGDKIIGLNGKEIERYEDALSTRLWFAKSVQVDRNGQQVDIHLPDTLFSFFKSGGRIIGLENHSLIITEILENSPAEEINLKPGDKILQVENTEITSFGRFLETVANYKNEAIVMIIDRGFSIDTVNTRIDSTGKFGIASPMPEYDFRDYTLQTAMKYGWKDAIESVNANIKGFSLIFKGKEKARDNLAGPIGIAKVYGGVWDWPKFWNLTAILSMILAFINILPIPALDGGHVMILTIEAVIGRKLPDKVMETIQIIGMVIIFALMIFIIGNDIVNLFR